MILRGKTLLVILNLVAIFKGSWGFFWDFFNDSPISQERCIDDEDYSCIDTVCKPEGYDKDKAPQNVSKIAGNIFIERSRVQSIDVRQAMFSFTAKLVIVWQDPRLRFCNQTSAEALDDSLLDYIWTPQLKVKKFATEFKDQDKSLYLTNTNTILGINMSSVALELHIRVSWNTRCAMHFDAFPLDRQVCKQNIEAKGHLDFDLLKFKNPETSAQYLSEDKRVSLDSLNLGYEITASLREKEKYLVLDITMERKPLPGILRIIMPPGLLVVLSWISFLLPMDQIPGRMGLLLTLLLCQITIFNLSIANSIQNSNAINYWTLSCMGFIILAISEYAILLGHKKYRKVQKCEEPNIDGPRIQGKIERLYVHSDKWMLVVFPPTFIGFAVLFWSLYLSTQYRTTHNAQY